MVLKSALPYSNVRLTRRRKTSTLDTITLITSPFEWQTYEMNSHKACYMLYGYWLSFQVRLALEGNGANDMLRPGSLSSFSGATVAKRRAA